MTGLVLHVGMDKTGSTAIQNGLFGAREALLADRGVLVPRAGAWRDLSHHGLAFGAYGMEGLGPDDLERTFAAMKAEIAASGADRVLISSECLFKLPDRLPDSPFFDHVTRMFDQVRVVAYVRRQDRWVESRHRHSIISGRESSVDELSRPQFCGYKRVIDLWSARFGQANLVLRPFERAQFPDGDILRDFCAAAAIEPLSTGCTASGNANAAFHHKDVLFRAAVNHLDLPSDVGDALNVFLLSRAHEGDPDRDLISARRARNLVSRYEGMNARLARIYLKQADGVLFREPLDTGTGEQALKVLAAEEGRAIFAELRERQPSVAQAIVGALAGLTLTAGAAPLAAERLRTLAAAAGLGLVTLAGTGRPGVFGPQASDARPRTPGCMKERRESRRYRAPLTAPGAATEPLVVHFGTHKTGSTSIQWTLFHANGPQRSHAYLDLGMPNHSETIATGFMTPEKLPRLRRGWAVDPVVQKSRRNHMRRLLARRLGQVPFSRPAVLSAEMIAHFDAPALADLDGFLAGFMRERIWLGYLREPVSYMRAVLEEALKTCRPPMRAYEPDARPGHLAPPYYRIVDRLDALAGRENVRVFAFNRDSFPSGDVVRHFLGQIGADAEAADIRRENTGLSMIAVKLLFLYRTLLCPNEGGRLAGATRRTFLADLSAIGGVPFRFHPDLVARIAAANGAFFDWAAVRLDRPMAPSTEASETGMRVTGDLGRLSAEEVEICSTWLAGFGVGLPARPEPLDLALAVHRVRRRNFEDALA